jgi:hypothetical protein
MIHDYKHLDKDMHHNISVTLTMEELAKRVCKANYGLHRFISEVVEIKRNSKLPHDKEFADDLEKALNKRYPY